MVRLVHSSALLILVVGCLSSAQAQTGNLYGSGTSEAAVLVRLINAQESGSAVLRLGSARLETITPGTMTLYHPIVADIYTLRYQGRSIEFIPRTGTLYTIIATGAQGLLILEDSAHNDPARAQIYVYNMVFRPRSRSVADADPSPADPTASIATGVSLKTADGQLELFRVLLPGKSAHRAVNAVKVQVAVFNNDGGAVSSPFDLILRRGSSTTVLLLAGPGEMVQVFTGLADIAGR